MDVQEFCHIIISSAVALNIFLRFFLDQFGLSQYHFEHQRLCQRLINVFDFLMFGGHRSNSKNLFDSYYARKVKEK